MRDLAHSFLCRNLVLDMPYVVQMDFFMQSIRVGLAATVLALAGCAIDLSTTDEAQIACTTGDECPQGLRCETTIAYCVPNNATGAGPLVVSSHVSTPRVGRSQTLQVVVTFERPLMSAPLAVLRLPTGDRPLRVESGEGKGPWTLLYATDGTESNGLSDVTAPFAATVFDRQGRVSRDVELGQVVIDFVPPALPIITVVGRKGAWVQSTELTLMFEISDGNETPASVRITGDVLPIDTVFASSVDISLVAGDGAKAVSMVFADEVGNETAAPGDLNLETTSPSAQLAITTLSSPTQFAPTLELFTHASSEAILFRRMQDVAPPDGDGFMASKDNGTFKPLDGAQLFTIPACPALTCQAPNDSLCYCENTTSVFRLAERDVFGNLTPVAMQAVLTLHQDSVPPGNLQVLTNFIEGSLSSDVGVIVLSPDDLTSGEISFEVFGGSLGEAVVTTTPPLVRLPALSSAATEAYSIRARDRAGNTSPVVTVIVADNPVEEMQGGASLDCAQCTRSEWTVKNNRVAFYERNIADPNNVQHILGACYEGSTETTCGKTSFVCPPSGVANTLCSTRYVVQAMNLTSNGAVWQDVTGNFPADSRLRYVVFGADQLPSSGDVGTTSGTNVLATNVKCVGAHGNQVVYGKWIAGAIGRVPTGSYQLHYQDFGSDNLPGAVGTDGRAECKVAAIAMAGTNPCQIDFDGRYVLYGDDSGRAVLHDFGTDGHPLCAESHGGGGTQLANKLPGKLLRAYTKLIDGRLFVRDPATQITTMIEPDDAGSFSSVNTTQTALPGINPTGGFGDKLSINNGTELYDISSAKRLGGHNAVVGAGSTQGFNVANGMFAGAMSLPGASQPRPARHRFMSEPFGFRFDDGSLQDLPRGMISSGTIAIPDADLVFSLNGGVAVYHRIEAVGVPDAQRVDVDASSMGVVWTSEENQILFLSFGPDGRPGVGVDGTSDDFAPIAITNSGLHLWPRISGSRIVWVELLNEDAATANGDWTAELETQLHGLDLGPNGIVQSTLGGEGWEHDDDSDDIVLSFPSLASFDVTWPDISGDRVVFLDYSVDADLCPTFTRGNSPDECVSTVRTFSLGDSVTTQLASSAPHGGLFIEGDTAVWSEFGLSPAPAPGCNTVNWDIKVRRVGASTVTLGSSCRDETLPSLDGNLLAYFSTHLDGTLASAMVRGAGTDGVFDSSVQSDDVELRRPCSEQLRSCFPGATDPGHVMQGPRYRWLEDGLLLLGSGIVPVIEPVDENISTRGIALAQASSGPLNGTDVLLMAVSPDVWVETMEVTLNFTTTSHAALRFELISPSGDTIELFEPITGSGATTKTLSLLNAPDMLNHWGEPLAGLWTLRMETTSAAANLTSWSIRHRR